MSPIPSVATAPTFFPFAPPIVPDPGSVGQSASVTSLQFLGTGGFLFAAVAIVSVAAYFYHGRGGANSTRVTNAWASLTGYLFSIRHRGSAPLSGMATADWPADVEVGPEGHVSMVYAQYFHPTFWNLVECHPATPSAPAIYVEGEAKEVPVSDPKPPGMNSFLDMDEDDENGNRVGRSKLLREKIDQGTKPRVKALPPYDTSSSTNVNFVNAIIGTTIRPGAFLPLPGQLEDHPSESSESESDTELDYSAAYGGIETPPPSPLLGARGEDAADLAYLSDGTNPEEGYGLVPTVSFRARLGDVPDWTETEEVFSWSELLDLLNDKPAHSDCGVGDHGSCISSCDAQTIGARIDSPVLKAHNSDSDSEFDSFFETCDSVETTPPTTPFSTRRYGMADMACFVEGLKGTILEEGHDLTPGISFETGLDDLHELLDADPVWSSAPWAHAEAMGDKPTASDCDIGVHDGPDGVQTSSCDAETLYLPDEGLDLMRRLLAELRDPNLDCSPRALSDSSDSEYTVSECDDEQEEDEPCVSRPGDPWSLQNMNPGAQEWSSSDSRTDRNDGPTHFLTPPSLSAVLDAVDEHQALVNDWDSTYSRDTEKEEEEAIVLRVKPPWDLRDTRRNSLESSSCEPRTRNDVFEGGRFYPSTPPVKGGNSLVSAPGVDVALSQGNDSRYSNDGQQEDEGASVPRLGPRPHNAWRNSSEMNSSDPRTDSNAPDEGPACRSTLPSKYAASLTDPHDIHKGRMRSPVLGEPDKEQIMSPNRSASPPSLPSKAYIRTFRDSRSFMYGPRSPLVALPRL